MKKLLSLSLMIGGLVGSVFTGSTITFHNGNNITASSKKIVKIEKGQKVAWLPFPEMGNPKKPC